MSYSAKTDLYLDANGQATTDKTGTPYLVTGAVISDDEAVRVGLKAAPIVESAGNPSATFPADNLIPEGEHSTDETPQAPPKPRTRKAK